MQMHIFRWIPWLAFLTACGGGGSPASEGDAQTSSLGTPPISYSVVNAYPHDTAAFTQGLELYQGQLYESTGLSGR